MKSTKDMVFVGEAGGIPGLVRITFDYMGRPVNVEIDDIVFKQTNKELVSDLFVAAINDGFAKIDAELKKQLADRLSQYYNQYQPLASDGPLGQSSDLDITKYFKGDPNGNSGNTKN